MSRPSLVELENHAEFIQRHIGPSVKQQAEMAQAMGYDSLDALIDAAVRRDCGPGSRSRRAPRQRPARRARR